MALRCLRLPTAVPHAAGIARFGTFKNCKNTGTVSANTKGKVGGVAGLSDYMNKWTVIHCYNTGKVSDSQVGYIIAPFDNQNVCLDVWEESKKEGATIGLFTLEYNSDGTVCIRNGYGQYLDIEGDTAKYVFVSFQPMRLS